MLQTKPKLNDDGESLPALRPVPVAETAAGNGFDVQRASLITPTPHRKSNQPTFAAKRAVDQKLRTRMPAILGEATLRGTIPVDGIINGQPGGGLTVKQHGRTFFGAEPELNGELSFNEMLRVNGHIAGSVSSRSGTLIVDANARVDASVDVGIAVIAGTVIGDIVARQRVELGPTAKVYGNIWTRSLAIQSGAIFEGVCQMLEDEPN
jgi:cytoskeletal protein CcmA (bactofilin family)